MSEYVPDGGVPRSRRAQFGMQLATVNSGRASRGEGRRTGSLGSDNFVIINMNVLRHRRTHEDGTYVNDTDQLLYKKSSRILIQLSTPPNLSDPSSVFRNEILVRVEACKDVPNA